MSAAYLEIIPGLALAGAPKSDLSDLSKLNEILTRYARKYRPNTDARLALLELKKVAKDPQADPANLWISKNWKAIAERSYQDAEKAFGKQFEADGILKNASDYYKECYRQHPKTTLAVTLAATGIVGYGIWKLFQPKNPESTNEKKEGGSAWPWLAGIGVLGGLAILANKYGGEILKMLDLVDDVEKKADAIQRAGKEAKEGKTAAAAAIVVEALTDQKPDDLSVKPEHQQGAEWINQIIAKQNAENKKKFLPISAETLAVYGKMKWGQMDSIINNINPNLALSEHVLSMLKGDLEASDPGYLLAVGIAIQANTNLPNEMQHLRRLIAAIKERNIPEMKGIKDDATVSEIMNLLTKNKTAIDQSFTQKPLQEKEGEDAVATGERAIKGVGEMAEKTVEMNKEFVGALEKELGGFSGTVDVDGEKKVRTISQVLAVYHAAQTKESGTWSEIKHQYEAAKDVTEILTQNKLNIVLAGPKILVMKGPKIIVNATTSAWSETLTSVFNEQDSKLETAFIYGKEAFPIVILGATTGATLGAMKGALAYALPSSFGLREGVVRGFIRGAGRGAIKGLLFPIGKPVVIAETVTLKIPLAIKFRQELWEVKSRNVFLIRKYLTSRVHGVIDATAKEAFDMQKLFLLERERRMLNNMRSSRLSIGSGKKMAEQVKEISAEINHIKNSLTAQSSTKEMIITLAEEATGVDHGLALAKRPELVAAMASDGALKSELLSPKYRELMGDKRFLAHLDEVLEEGKRLAPDQLAKKVGVFCKGFESGMEDIAAALGRSTAGGMNAIEEEVKALKSQWNVQEKLIKMAGSEAERASLTAHSKQLKDRLDQVQSLKKIMDKSGSMHAIFLKENPQFLASVAEDSVEARVALAEFARIDKRLVKDLLDKPDEIKQILGQLTKVRRNISLAEQNLQTAREAAAALAKSKGVSVFELTGDLAEVQEVMRAQSQWDEQMALLKIMRTKKSKFGELIRKMPGLLDELTSNPQKLKNFLALDPKIVQYFNRSAESGKAALDEFRAALSGNKASFEAWLTTMGEKCKISKVIARHLNRAGKGLSYAVSELSNVRNMPGKISEIGKRTFSVGTQKALEWFVNFKGAKIGLEELMAMTQSGNRQEIRQILEKTMSGAGKSIHSIDQARLDDLVSQIANAKNEGAISELINKFAVANKVNLRAIPKPNAILKILGTAGKLIGPGLIGLGTYTTYDSLSKAANANSTEERNAYLARGAMGGVETAVGAWQVAETAKISSDALKALYAGSKVLQAGRILTPGSGVGLALMPITYMGTEMFESKIESFKSPQMWAEEKSAEQLIHEWFTTGERTTAGQAYRLGATLADFEKEEVVTRQNIIGALLLKEGGNKDQWHYFETMRNFEAPSNYSEAREWMQESRLYARIMASRQAAIDEGVEYLMAEQDITGEQYNHPSKEVMRNWINIQKTEALQEIGAEQRFIYGRMSTGALIELFLQLSEQAETDELSEEQNQIMVNVANYLTLERNVDLTGSEMVKRSEGVNPIGIEALSEITEKIEQNELPFTIEKELVLMDDQAACYALYRYASFFGYQGGQTESELRIFFAEDRENENQFGLYWSESKNAWMANEAGTFERDDSLGQEINDEMIKNLITHLKEKGDDTFYHRSDALTSGSVDEGARTTGQAALLASSLDFWMKKYEQHKTEANTPIQNVVKMNQKNQNNESEALSEKAA
ncbi:hypothetical protein IPJ72_01730 [Candidatus Peregrinibacteria bacterium]|nr:MAG: hypothetical protein IPJ72_01730 [Candidatus Peregrinibacteria bacterium]